MFLWQNGQDKINALPGRHLYAAGINNQGQIVGAYSAQPQAGNFTPFVYANGKLRLLGVLARNGGALAISEAYAVSSNGQVVGISNGQAFSWKGGRLRGLPMPPRFTTTTAFAVNSKGQAVGSGWGRAEPCSAPMRCCGRGTRRGPGDVARLRRHRGARHQRARPGDWLDQPAASRRLGGSFGRLWQSGKMRDLGTLPGDIRDTRANAINDRGEVVGRIVGRIVRKSNERAVLWRGGRVYNLNDLIPPGTGWILQEAVALNNQGWIIGNGKHNGVAHAFLLRPR